MKQSDLLSQWKKRKTNTSSRIQARPSEASARPSAGQQRLFLLQQLHPGNPFYQYAHRYELRGNLDVEKLRESFNWLVNRHEVLRSNYTMDEPGDISMTFQPTDTFSLEQGLEEALNEETLTAEEAAFSLRPFDLATDPPFRAKLFNNGPAAYRLVIAMHHIIGDRGSLMVLEQELFAHYTKLVEGGPLPEAQPPVLSFADYAYWEANRTVPEAHYTYWKQQLSGELPYAELPYDFQRPAVSSFKGKLLQVDLSAQVSNQVRVLARAHATTANVVFLAVLNAFLYRYTGQEDILVGVPVSTRDRRELEALVGFLNETVVLRNGVDGEKGLADIVMQLKPRVETALTYKDVSFDWLVTELAPARPGGENPFFQTMFVYNGLAPERTLPSGLKVEDQYLDLGTSKFDLSLFASEHENHFSIGFEYATDLFKEETIAVMLRHFSVLLEDAIAKPAAPIGTRALLTKADRQKMLLDWNPTLGKKLEFPLLPTHLATWAAKKPEATAITDGTTSLSYGNLEKNSAALAAKLLTAGLTSGTPVGLYCGRSPELLVGILGIMRAGGAYVPLDPEYPEERVDFIMGDAGARLIVHQSALSPPLMPSALAIAIPESATANKDIDFPSILPEQLAYIIYTSGSTGQPKGIPISHANLAHSTAARFPFYKEQPSAFLLLSSFAFDSSVAGIFWTLANGGKLVLTAHRAEQDPAGLSQLIRSEQVTHTLMLPSLYQLLLEFSKPVNLSSLQVVMVAGEACSTSLVGQHFAKLPDTSLVNEYGPTEGTVWSTAHHLEPGDSKSGVPIGRPIHGVGHYVLDRHLQPVPVGVVGELYLSGPGLSAGYLGRTDLTEERFLSVDLGAAAGATPGTKSKEDKQRLYKTGDLVRYRKNGLLDFLGRSDNQVKIRGHRIEPAEISKVMDRLPGIRKAIVKVFETEAGPQLAAYFTNSGPEAPAAEEVAHLLRKQLPAYMVPAAFVSMAAFPRLPNGKFDLRALPAPSTASTRAGRPYAAPKGEAEISIALIWEKVLGHAPISRHDNFFEIGGDSLRSIRIIAAAKKAGVPLAPHQLFNHPTIAELAAAIAGPKEVTEAAEAGAYQAVVLLRKGRSTAPPLFCLHSGGGHVFFYRDLAMAMDGERSVYAVQPQGLMGEEKVQNSIETMASDYLFAIKSLHPNGPYHFLGTCFSNAVALEMANQLQATGGEVGRLFIIDSGTGAIPLHSEALTGATPLQSLLNLVKGGHWSLVHRQVEKRFILTRRRIESKLSEQRKNLYATIGALNKIFDAYTWPKYRGGVTLIRSSEFANRPDKDYHLAHWKALTENPVEVHVVPGEHKTLFDDPAVRGLAQQIDECLQPATT